MDGMLIGLLSAILVVCVCSFMLAGLLFGAIMSIG